MKTRATSAGELFRRMTEGKTHTLYAGNAPDEVLVEPWGLDQRWRMSAAEQHHLAELLHERYWGRGARAR